MQFHCNVLVGDDSEIFEFIECNIYVTHKHCSRPDG